MSEASGRILVQGRQAGSRYVLALPRRLPMGLAGSQMGHRAGASLEFKDHREYEVGDDLRRLDWSAYARTDKLHIKLYREEISPHLDLLLDGSRSMALPDSPKAEATLGLAAALATAADNSRCTHATWVARDGCRAVVEGHRSPEMWGEVDFDHDQSVAESLAQLPPAWRSRSIRILVSDLLWLGDPLAVLQPMAQGAAVVVVIQLLAAADVDPPQRGNVRLVDSETGLRQEVFVDAAAQKRYVSALARHQEQWHRAATRVGAVMRTLVAEELLEDWNLRVLVEAEVLKPA